MGTRNVGQALRSRLEELLVKMNRSAPSLQAYEMLC